MRNGVGALLLSALISSSAVAEDCTFDQAHHARVVAAIGQRISGGKPDADGRLTWQHADGSSTTFAYGGCAHLGSSVTRSTPGVPRNPSQVFSLARDLAVKFWSNDDVVAHAATDGLVKGLRASDFTREEGEGRTMYYIGGEPLYVLTIIHEYAAGVDRVTVQWTGQF